MTDLKGYAKEFKKQITRRSKNKIWEEVIKEWIDTGKMFRIDDLDLEEINKKYEDVEFKPMTCICGHGIVEHCVIENKITKIKIAIGNCCIEKFGTEYHEKISKRYRKISTTLKKMKASILNEHTIKMLNEDILEFLLKNNYLDEEEYEILKENRLAIKKRKGEIKSKIAYEEFIKVVKILMKIIRRYYNVEINKKKMNVALFDMIMNMISDKEYKEKYYNENVEKCPENENKEYELICKADVVNNKHEWKWECVAKKIKCKKCKKTKMTKIKNIVETKNSKIILQDDDEIIYDIKDKFTEEGYCL